MKPIFTFIIIIISQLIYSQNIVPYEPFSFESYTPKWKHLVIDSTNITKSNDGMSFLTFPLSPILYKKSIFSIKRNFFNNFQGDFIERIDVNTGISIWQKSHDLRDSKWREYPIAQRVNRNDIEIFSCRQSEKEIVGNIWFGGKLSNRKLSLSTGEELFHNNRDKGDSISEQISTNVAPSGIGIYYFMHKNNVLHLLRRATKSNGTMKAEYGFRLIDSIGHLIEKKTVTVPCTDCDLKLNSLKVSLEKTNDDRFISINQFTVKNINFQKDSSILQLVILDGEFNVVKNINITKKVPRAFNYSIQSVGENDFVLFARDYSESSRLLVLNYDGDILSNVALEDKLRNPLPLGNFKLQKLDDEDAYLMAAKYNGSQGHDFLVFYKLKDNKLDTLKTLKIKPSGHWLIPENILGLDNGDVILECRHKKTVSSNEVANWSTWMSFSAKDLGLTTSNNKLSTKAITPFIIYPNPSYGQLFVEFSNPFKGTLEIYSAEGKYVDGKIINGTKVIEWDVQHLAKGTYIIKGYDNHDVEIASKLIIKK